MSSHNSRKRKRRDDAQYCWPAEEVYQQAPVTVEEHAGYVGGYADTVYYANLAGDPSSAGPLPGSQWTLPDRTAVNTQVNPHSSGLLPSPYGGGQHHDANSGAWQSSLYSGGQASNQSHQSGQYVDPLLSLQPTIPPSTTPQESTQVPQITIASRDPIRSPQHMRTALAKAANSLRELTECLPTDETAPGLPSTQELDQRRETYIQDVDSVHSEIHTQVSAHTSEWGDPNMYYEEGVATLGGWMNYRHALDEHTKRASKFARKIYGPAITATATANSYIQAQQSAGPSPKGAGGSDFIVEAEAESQASVASLYAREILPPGPAIESDINSEAFASGYQTALWEAQKAYWYLDDNESALEVAVSTSPNDSITKQLKEAWDSMECDYKVVKSHIDQSLFS
ncbi:hypothetical protein I316_01563 [Kwoniella heveanensis BCC8398]|uniref:Uncharacterized protein n=1 Tax=Kwoniella heveanensis BCC8398 TaxID=1296120 RepID=A0A1B9H123_9TREE|nr:hypothetical protein I316_01563 [Kwoniella heveanensis BCC8398]